MPTICRLTDECRLTSLPPELRSLIYRYAVVADQPLIAFFDCQAKQKPADSADTKRVSYHYKLLPARPELASTSRQLRDEVLPIFYGGNTFIFSLDSMFCNVIGRWVKLAQRAPATSHIRNVVLEFDVKRRALVVRRPRDKLSRFMEPAVIKISISNDAQAPSFSLAGTLAEDCTCMLSQAWQAFTKFRSNWEAHSNNAVLDFCEHLVGDEVKDWYWRCGRGQERVLCDECGKDRTVINGVGGDMLNDLNQCRL